MNDKANPWDKEFDRLLELLRSGQIESDPNYYIVSIDGILQIMRGDMLPIFSDNVSYTLNSL